MLVNQGVLEQHVDPVADSTCPRVPLRGMCTIVIHHHTIDRSASDNLTRGLLPFVLAHARSSIHTYHQKQPLRLERILRQR